MDARQFRIETTKLISRNCLAHILDNIVMQMRKFNARWVTRLDITAFLLGLSASWKCFLKGTLKFGWARPRPLNRGSTALKGICRDVCWSFNTYLEPPVNLHVNIVWSWQLTFVAEAKVDFWAFPLKLNSTLGDNNELSTLINNYFYNKSGVDYMYINLDLWKNEWSL